MPPPHSLVIRSDGCRRISSDRRTSSSILPAAMSALIAAALPQCEIETRRRQ